MHLKMLCIKWQPLCFSLSVLNALLEGLTEVHLYSWSAGVDIVAAGPMVHDAGLSATEYQVIKERFNFFFLIVNHVPNAAN